MQFENGFISACFKVDSFVSILNIQFSDLYSQII